MLAYEQLKASTGREIWFRPPRYEARKLFPQFPPGVRVRSHTYKLQNISLGGIAAVSNRATEDILEPGEIVPLTIQQAGLSIFEGLARVCRTEHTFFGSKVAFNIVDGFIELDKLLDRNAQARIAMKASLLSADANQLVPKEYRSFCADVLHVLRSYRSVLDENMALARQFDRTFNQDGAFEACEARMVQHWRALWRTGNDIAAGLMNDRERLAAAKEFTELVLTPEMRLGAIWDRSYSKPLGYPGDFEVMNQVYDWERRGDSVYAMLLHRLGLEVAECIKTRMEVVRAAIAETVRAKANGRPARILSLGSGPAREVEQFLGSPHSNSRQVEFTLIDQEHLALRYAYDKTYPHVAGAKGLSHVQCLHMSFIDILRGTSALGSVPPQDLIYSVGLLDYLADKRASVLARRLYDALAPQGLLIIGNMSQTSLSNLWPMELIADWTLHYRSETDMLAWIDGQSVASAWTETEPTGRVRLLFARKP